MKTYTYDTATGPVTVAADERWYKLLSKADAEEANANRKHTRSDHKYAPGEPVSLDALKYEGEWVADHCGGISAIELSADLERAFAALTKRQRLVFALSRIDGYSNVEIARHYGVDESTIREILRSAEKRIKMFME
jgi:RNA polymerase sigma factor (sigma-70 family)